MNIELLNRIKFIKKKFLWWIFFYPSFWVEFIEGLIGVITLGCYPRTGWYVRYLTFEMKMRFKYELF
jgi:hypothetical protein